LKHNKTIMPIDRFEEYYQTELLNKNKLHYDYLGINKKEYSKWCGWKIIKTHKERGTKISEIDDHVLDILVRTHYLLLYIKNML